jgi:ankyrin repeat protein
VHARQILDAANQAIDSERKNRMIWCCHEDVLAELDRRGYFNSKDSGGRTPLSWAAENGHEAVVKLLEKAEHSLSGNHCQPPHPPSN